MAQHEYEIVRCDVVKDCNDTSRPLLYFKADMDMILFAQNNNNFIHIDIFDSEFYCGKQIAALVDISSNLPSYRPNFFEACHLYTVTLTNTPWKGFCNPNALGKFIINRDVLIPSCWKATGKPCNTKELIPILPEPPIPLRPQTNLVPSAATNDCCDNCGTNVPGGSVPSGLNTEGVAVDVDAKVSQTDDEETYRYVKENYKSSKLSSLQIGLIVLLVILVICAAVFIPYLYKKSGETGGMVDGW